PGGHRPVPAGHARSNGAVLPRSRSNHQGGAASTLFQQCVALDEGLELLDSIEDRLDTHPGALPASMKPGNSILAERCPRMYSFPSRRYCPPLMHPQILREILKNPHQSVASPWKTATAPMGKSLRPAGTTPSCAGPSPAVRRGAGEERP